jgi:hypothetical protein
MRSGWELACQERRIFKFLGGRTTTLAYSPSLLANQSFETLPTSLIKYKETAFMFSLLYLRKSRFLKKLQRLENTISRLNAFDASKIQLTEGHAPSASSSASSTVTAFAFPFSNLRASSSLLGTGVDSPAEDPATETRCPSPDSGGGAEVMFVLWVIAGGLGPGNSWLFPQFGKTLESSCGSGTRIRCVLPGVVVLCDVAMGAEEPDWSAVAEGGVWMAFVSDESIDDACE